MRHELTRVLPYRPDQLFELVGDVRRYPEFVPWITSLRVWDEREEGPGVDQLKAEAAVGFAFLKERFGTSVRRDRPAQRIDVGLLYGPFRRLQNVWTFEPHPQGTQVGFLIDFEFKSRLLDALLKANFERAVGKIMACFDARARELYGPEAARTA